MASTRLRLAYLLPALADLWLSVSTLVGMRGVANESLLMRGEFAAVTALWALILFMALARPYERAWVLLPTAIVVLGIGAAFSWAAFAGAIPLWRAGLALGLVLPLSWLAFTEWHATSLRGTKNAL